MVWALICTGKKFISFGDRLFLSNSGVVIFVIRLLALSTSVLLKYLAFGYIYCFCFSLVILICKAYEVCYLSS